MAKIINNFIIGGVNKDADDRLIPNGSVRDLENCITNTSEGDDKGTLENFLGNKILTDLSSLTFINNGSPVTPNVINPVVIGSFADNPNNRIFYFITSDNWDLIVEYNKTTNTLSKVIAELSQAGGKLQFDKTKRITHINIIKKSSVSGDVIEDSDLLAFCGDDNPPRILNIERFKQLEQIDYEEDEINVIKPQPRQAPSLTPLLLEDEGNGMENKFFVFAYRYKYKDGFYSAISSTTENLFTPSSFNINFDTFENEGMVNIYNACDIHFNTGKESVIGIQLLYKESNDQNWYIIEDFKKIEEGWGDNTEQTFRFKNKKNYRVLPQREYFRSFDNVPLSSVTQEYVNGRLFYFNFKEQRNLTDFNGDNVELLYSVDFESNEVINAQYPTLAETFPSSLTSGETVGLTSVSLGALDTIQEGSRLEIRFDARDNENDVLFDETFSFVFNETLSAGAGSLAGVLHLYQPLRDAFSDFRQLFIDNGFSEPIGATSSTVSNTTFKMYYTSSNVFKIELPEVVFNTGTRYVYSEINTSFVISNVASSSSMKSIRDYEVAMIFMDKEGRKTTALTSKDNATYIPISNSDTQNILKVSIPQEQKIPVWADRYKFAVKKVGFYETFFSNRYYIDGAFRWIKLEGGDENKINIGDDIIVKRDSDNVQNTIGKVKVLDLKSQVSDFIEGNTVSETGADIVEESGVYIRVRPQGFSLDYAEEEFINVNGQVGIFNARPFLGLNVFSKEFSDNAGGTVLGDLPFQSGTIFDIRELKSFRVNADESLVKETFVANQNYGNVHDFLTAVNTYVPNGVTQTNETGFFKTQGGDDDYLKYWIYRGEILPITANVAGNYLESEGTIIGFGEADDPNTGKVLRLDDNFPYVMIIKGSEAGTNKRKGRIFADIQIRVVDGYYVFETEEKPVVDDIFYETPETYFIENPHTINASYPQQEHLLSRFFNCYTMGNGAESYRYKDKFNANFLDIQSVPTTVTEDEYRQLNRFADITYSGVFNDNTGVNGLNEFNLSLANFKDDLEKQYGAGYRMHRRNTDLVLFQEDKVSFVRVGESELFNADDTSNVVRIENVLGNQVMYSGEYGISKDGDSFAYYGNSLYFTDAKRGVVCRLLNNGIFEISKQGMKSYFRNLFREKDISQIIGSYDDFTDAYVINLKYGDEYVTWYYKESINEFGGGWVGRPLFNPDDMVSLNGNLYSFNSGNVYEHNIREEGFYNTFYGVTEPSKFTILMNESPYNRKNFKTIELDGTDKWDIDVVTNLGAKGHVDIDDYETEEGVYRAFLRGDDDVDSIDTNSLHVQGIGEVQDIDEVDSLLTFSSINEEVSIGDKLATNSLEIIGVILDIFPNNIIEVDVDANFTLSDLSFGDYILSFKPQSVETSGLVGYALEVTGSLNTTNKTELFNVASEVFLSTPNTAQ